MLRGELKGKETQQSWLQWQQERPLPAWGDDPVRPQPPQPIKARGGTRQGWGTRLGCTAPSGASVPPSPPLTPTQMSGLQVTRGDEKSFTPQNQDPEKTASTSGRPSRVWGSPGWPSPPCSRYREHS